MAKPLNMYDVLVRPIVTEKSNALMSDLNQYVFEVDMRANKIQIKEAIEIIFDVDVLKVHTLILPAKRSRRGRKFYMRKPNWKKAVITIAEGQHIPLFNT
jgi:large subunit ribosomal protein L23